MASNIQYHDGHLAWTQRVKKEIGVTNKYLTVVNLIDLTIFTMIM